jgi:hypothetical protein
LQDKYRTIAKARGGQLWACSPDFKQAFDRMPRDRSWQQLQQIGVGSCWLAAAKAIQTEVPVTVAGGLHAINTPSPVEQGCPA